MANFQGTPNNLNPLSPTGYQFFIRKMPTTNFFLQEVNIPGISIPPVNVATPLVTVPYSGDHINYEPLAISFLVDEDMKNWIEIYTWIRQLGFSRDNAEYARIARAGAQPGLGTKSDATLLVLGGKKRARLEFQFTDAFPVSLTKIDMKSTASDTDYAVATAVFYYTLFDIQRVTAGDSSYAPVDGGVA